MSDSSPDSAAALAALAVWLDDFPDHIKQRGRTYFKQGRVRHLSGEGNEVHADVTGSMFYETGLSWENGNWWSTCTCPIGEDCKHTFAVGLAWSRNFERRDRSVPLRPDVIYLPETMPPPAPPGHPAADLKPKLRLFPEDQPVVAEFTTITGRPPTIKELAWLRNLQRVFRTLPNLNYGSHWFDLQALQNLAPAAQRAPLYGIGFNPFQDFWTKPPATPLKLWPFIALLFQDHQIPLPDFTAAFTDLAGAEASRRAVLHERQLTVWRERFALLEKQVTVPPEPTPQPATLRLVLGPKKLSWEKSTLGPSGPFAPCPMEALRPALHDYGTATLNFDDGSNILLTALRARSRNYGRGAFRLSDPQDAEIVGAWLAHPVARRHVVGPAGEAVTDDPHQLTWKIADHPSESALVVVSPMLSDGSALPPGTVHLPGTPPLYLHGTTLFHGPPPLLDNLQQTNLPREVLALPEAGRFAARIGLKLPGAIADRFRHEPLRPRLRVKLFPSGRYAAELLQIELHALSETGAPRARWESLSWNTEAPDLERPADAAFLLHDFAALHPATRHLGQLPNLHWTTVDHCYLVALQGNFADTFSGWLSSVPTGVLVELSSELAAFAAPPTRGHFALEATESGIDWFDVSVQLRVEDTTLTDEEIALLRRANGRFIRLEGKGWRRLQVELDEAARTRLEKLGLDPTTVASEGRELPRFHALQLADESLGDALPEKLWRQIRDRAAAIRQIPAPPLPAGLRAELRPYQLEGFHYLAHLAENHFGGVLADDMGLGKTLQALAWLLWLAERPKPDVRNTNKSAEGQSAKVRIKNIGGDPAQPFRALIVCPKSVVFNWETETTRFAPSLTTGRLSPRADSPLPADTRLVVINYTQLRLHAALLADETWDAVILDEGQNIKNPASATAQAARALRTTHRLVLTGTPIENRLLDLWSLFAFAQPGLLGGQTQFKRLYNDKTDPGARARLATRVRHFLLRRTKGQVARDLPPRTEEDIIVELDGPQRTLYDAELKRARALLLKVETSRDFDAARFNILQSLLRLRQICCDPRLLGAELTSEKPARPKSTVLASALTLAASGIKTVASAKLEALLDTLEPLVAEGHRVLVFSQFVTMLEIIRAELSARDIKFLLLTGQTENRQELVQQFQSAEGPPVFLLSLKAAGSGLNLTAASYVVLYDPWWNPAVEAQAIDRTHRIGQTAHVLAYRLLARNTVEEKIRALQKEKAALAASVVQEESLAKVLDLESLRQILS